jgi:hypothetical protein
MPTFRSLLRGIGCWQTSLNERAVRSHENSATCGKASQGRTQVRIAPIHQQQASMTTVFTLGNALLKSQLYKVGTGIASETITPKIANKVVDGQPRLVIDLPGLHDSKGRDR